MEHKNRCYSKISKVISSCRTLGHIDVANNMIKMYLKIYPDDIIFSSMLKIELRERKQVIIDYANTLEGTKVISISNEDEPVNVGVVEAFCKIAEHHTTLLPFVRFEKDNIQHTCMGLLIPFEEGLEDKLNAIPYQKRWNTYSKNYKLKA